MNIIKFPKMDTGTRKPVSVPAYDFTRESVKPTRVQRVLNALLSVIWAVTVLVWPLLKWVLSIEIFFQMLRMFYHWNTPGMYAGWTFLLHFSVLVALTYFVEIFRPKNMN